jgi:hypothetical protein
MKLPAVKTELHGKQVLFDLPPDRMDEIQAILEKHNGFLQITIDRPFRPRSTGKDSQNHRINGFIQQICVETGNDFDAVKQWCKQQAISQGYPAETFAGEAFPKSEARASVEDAKILIETVERLAAELGIILKETE